MIKVLIVDDSRVAQEFLVHILSADPAIQVVGIASNGEEALIAVNELHPDVITMDIYMPKMDGYETTRAIMESVPTPIIVVSSNNSVTEATATFHALEAGALTVVLRPHGLGHPEYTSSARDLVQMVKMMSEIKVVRRHSRLPKGRVPTTPPVYALTPRKVKLFAIGASTGGPMALLTILSGLPLDLPVPVLIVQHILKGFTQSFVEWLAGASHFPLHVAAHGEIPLAGHAYVAPDGWHMGISSGPRILLSDGPPENGGLRPAVDYLFRSVAQTLGPCAVGVLLTGMGRDGAEELKAMKDKGALTIAQDEASSVIHGMPGVAIKLGAAVHVIPLESIAAMLVSVVRKTNG